MKRRATAKEPIPGWSQLRHTGLLLDGPRLRALADHGPEPPSERIERRLRQRATAFLGGIGDGSATSDMSQFVAFVLEEVCGFDSASGDWQRGSRVPRSLGRRAVTGETVKPRHVWNGPRGASLPVFLDDAKRIGIGRGRRVVSQVLGWLRAGGEHLALVTNGRDWQLVFAGLDYDASCRSDAELWFEEGRLAAQVTALRTLIQPALWTPPEEGAASQLLQAIRDARKGQADLSEVLGERVREAVEVLVQSHGEALKAIEGDDRVTPAEIYRAACRVAMRAVVVLFAESRKLLPRDNPVYDEGYGLNGLVEQLEKSARSRDAMGEAYGAWPRVLALFRLVFTGSHHPDLPVHAYGGELFAPGRPDAADGVSRALHVFENACFADDVLPDRDVYRILRLLTRSRARIQQGRASTWVTVPVDFSDLSSEYIGIVYEGLLDYELKTAPAGDPVAFLAVGDRPALPLSRLEEMDDKALKGLFEKLKKPSSADDAGAPASGEDGADAAEGDEPGPEADQADDPADARRTSRTRAEEWARRAARVAGLVPKPRGRLTPERRLAYDRKVAEAARKLVHQIVLPDEWYLARWGGTRKGSGSFYTRPGLTVPTVQRTLRPLAYNPPSGLSWEEAAKARPARWTPRLPEEILSLKVCDPACGSGSFALAALRFLTDALYLSLQHHGRIRADGNRSLVWLLGMRNGDEGDGERLSDEQIPCRPDDGEFEERLKARLRRHVVERCIYAVDLDPLAIELCRLSLWIETMDRDLPFGFLDHKVKCGNALVGAWFDQFQHYPAMAWKNREGGDKNHSNGVHFQKNARGKAIKEFHKNRLTPDMKRFLEGRTLFEEDLMEKAATAQGDAVKVLAKMHELPIQDAAERADVYRRELLGSPAWRSLKEAMDLWCACWFWPADAIEVAPLPTSFTNPLPETQAVVRDVNARHRFFHWELEFPDVFRKEATGFDAVLGNPPWENSQPNPEEFFSNEDPLFRTYGRLVKRLRQQEMFQADVSIEKHWVDYVAWFKDFSNWVRNCANPFGDPQAQVRGSSSFPLGRGGKILHQRWRKARQAGHCFSDPDHAFRLQMGRIFTYPLFLEQCLALLRTGGRCGLIIPSGIYSDAWTRPLRIALIERCRWEWLFGIENSGKVFPIHRSYKFNPIIVEKGGSTEAIRTAFMRSLEEWERAEYIATPYTRAQVERFSPKSRAILEIQSRRDLEILEKIYANSVLLGDDGPEGWGIKYKLEFMMNTDAKLFPPRPTWEAKRYRPDEYSRWLKGDWRPIGELWAELGVDPGSPIPAEVELEDWLFDTSADPERREGEARFVHDHLLKPGDLARTDWEVRCAQPPYDRLPVPRAAIPPGIILSRAGTEWIWEGAGIEDVALPLYEGRMIGQFDFTEKGWVSGKGRGAVWREIPWELKQIEPQFLMRAEDYYERVEYPWRPKVAHMNIGSATNARTAIGTFLTGMPAGHSVPTLNIGEARHALTLTAVFNSLVSDFVTRGRVTGLHLDYHVLEQNPVLRPSDPIVRSGAISRVARALCVGSQCFALAAPEPDAGPDAPLQHRIAVTISERLRLRAILDAAVAVLFGLDRSDFRRILEGCDHPSTGITGQSQNPKGFWRIDKDRDPELRHTVLTLVAFRHLESKLREFTDQYGECFDRFLGLRGREGWMLPETIRLADYGLGHDDRARRHQPVASRLGPRFYDWQLAQTPEEAWDELRLHARNLLGRDTTDDGSDSGGPAVPPSHDSASPTRADTALRAAEPEPGYSARPSQTEMLPRTQTDMFE